MVGDRVQKKRGREGGPGGGGGVRGKMASAPGV